LCGGEDGALDEDILETLLEIAGSGLVLCSEEFGSELLGDRVVLYAVLLGIKVSLLLLGGEMTSVLAFSQRAGTDAVLARLLVGTVFESVEEEIEGPYGRGVVGWEACDMCQSGGMSEGVGEAGDAVFSEQEHQEEGAEHPDRVSGCASPRIGGVEGLEGGSCRFQVKVEEHECRIEPRIGKRP